jgi:energy-coupling factor transport system ATP-binding protein
LNWQPLPLTIKEGRRFSQPWLAGQVISAQPAPFETLPATSRPNSTTPAAGEPYLQLRQVDASYADRPVLQGIDLEVWSGQVMALLGRNGAGKSTLLRTIVGLVRPRRGQIRVAGWDIAGLDVAQICQRVGYLPQDPNALLFADTALEELFITLRNHGLASNGRVAAGLIPPQQLLEQLGLGDKAGDYPRDLSAGERQRVALGAVTVTRPGALLLDEPTRGLDYQAKELLVELLARWRDEGMAILLVTHDVELAALVADRVVLLSQGEIIASGAPAEVLGTSPLFAPQVARLFPGTGWLTVKDVLGATGVA